MLFAENNIPNCVSLITVVSRRPNEFRKNNLLQVVI